jgi:hypothetical protein
LIRVRARTGPSVCGPAGRGARLRRGSPGAAASEVGERKEEDRDERSPDTRAPVVGKRTEERGRGRFVGPRNAASWAGWVEQGRKKTAQL